MANPEVSTAIPHTTPKMGVVAAMYTTPETVIEDYGKLLKLANYQDALAPGTQTLLKINLTWQHYYPACSTTPWQMDGVIKQLKADGYDDLMAAHNGTVVVDPFEGEIKNKHKVVEEKHGIPSITLDVAPNRWVPYTPKGDMLVLNDVFPDGLFIPETFADKNVIHFPTVKTHVFTQMTGAMKNAFGGLLHRNRHWTHAVIHETLVDLLTIQKEIHPGIFAVMDGTFAGDGPGPRAMRWHEKNLILASADQVAIDSIAAKLMGLDPMSLPKVRLAHEAGLGVGDPSEIEIIGEDVSNVNWHFASGRSTFASRGQKLIYHGPLKPLDRILLRSFVAPWAFFASNVYHNSFWLRFIGRKRVAEARETGWGRLFQSY